MNKCIFTGNITKDLELRQAGTTQVLNFDIAVNYYKSKKQEVVYVRLVAFGKQAEAIAKYCQKGSKIMVSGYLKDTSYTNKLGEKVYQQSLMIEEVEFLNQKQANEQTQSTPYNNGYQYSQPQQNAYGSQETFDPLGSSPLLDVSSDDLPF